MLNQRSTNDFDDRGNDGDDCPLSAEFDQAKSNLGKQEEDKALLSRFSNAFTPEAQMIACNLSMNNKMKGGTGEKGEDIISPVPGPNSFPGRHFSYSLTLYMARLGLEECDKEEAYRRFVEDVYYYFEHAHENAKAVYNNDIEYLPTREFIEEITSEGLEKLKDMRLEFDGPDDGLRHTG